MLVIKSTGFLLSGLFTIAYVFISSFLPFWFFCIMF